MSFKPNNTVTLNNYEEYFLLYVDAELDAAGKKAVEVFVAQHPHLAGELDLLMSSKLPADAFSFAGKADLLSPAMKLNAVDEDLLLYLDGELPAAAAKVVEQKIADDKDYALQHTLLRRTKLDAAEEVLHPNKRELYRRAERVRLLPVWMRYAAAVLILLFGGWFFLTDNQEINLPTGNLANGTKQNLPVVKEPTPVQRSVEQSLPQKDETITATAQAEKPVQNKRLPAEPNKPAMANSRQTTVNETETAAVQKERPAVRFEASRFTTTQEVSENIALNKTITRNDVTSGLDERTTATDGGAETAGSEADFKDTRKTPAKGFFRKVSRFIERRTGIGTVNDDNELLIGAVALKLK